MRADIFFDVLAFDVIFEIGLANHIKEMAKQHSPDRVQQRLYI